MTGSTVLVTGATGYIAQHVVDKLLERKYRVIGTARSESRYTSVLKNFELKYPGSDLSFEIVPDMAADHAFDEVLKSHPEIKYVIHTASPASFGLNLPLEETYLRPAVNGTLNILKGIKNFAPQITNVVITSSIVAIFQRGDAYRTETLTNKLWNPITWEEVDNEYDAYNASKKYAEQAARRFYEEEKPNFKLATVNPPLVAGPQLFDSSVSKTLNTSNEIINQIAHLDPTSIKPQDSFPLISIDVRDIAEFHVLPLENERLAEERIAIASSPFIAQRILNILNDNFPELEGKICKGDYDSAERLEEELCPKYDFSSTLNKIGGYRFIPLEESVVDLYKQYFEKYNFS